MSLDRGVVKSCLSAPRTAERQHPDTAQADSAAQQAEWERDYGRYLLSDTTTVK